MLPPDLLSLLRTVSTWVGGGAPGTDSHCVGEVLVENGIEVLGCGWKRTFLDVQRYNGRVRRDLGGLVAKSCLSLATPWTVACQAPGSMGFSRQEYWLSFPSPGDLPNAEIKPGSPALQAHCLLTELSGILGVI